MSPMDPDRPATKRELDEGLAELRTEFRVEFREVRDEVAANRTEIAANRTGERLLGEMVDRQSGPLDDLLAGQLDVLVGRTSRVDPRDRHRHGTVAIAGELPRTQLLADDPQRQEVITLLA